MNSLILLLPVLLPIAAGLVISLCAFRSEHVRNVISLSAVLMTSALAAYIAVSAYYIISSGSEPAVLDLFHITGDMSFSFRCDGLSIVFISLIAFLWPLSTLYAFEYTEHSLNRDRFFGFYTACYGITAGIALSANMITMYFFYELLTLVTVPLIAHEGDRRSAKAVKKYMIYSIAGASLSFVGIVLLESRGLSGGFIYAGEASVGSPYRRELILAYFLTFTGFGVKAAIFPLHGWLPSAGVAPTPVTALLHAVAVVKSGVFAIIRSTFFVFGPEFLSGTWAAETALVISGFTVVFGSAMALREQHLKRRLAYSTISNLSYILVGVLLLSSQGLQAGACHMLFHGIMKITLFFCAGAVITRSGYEYVPQLNGLGRRMPLTFGVFTLASLALTGAPLLPGFISKMKLLNAAAALSGSAGDIDPPVLFSMISLLISALLTAAYLVPVCVRAFIPSSGCTPAVPGADITDPGRRMLLPLLILSAAMIVLGLNSGWLMNILEVLL